MSEPVRKKFRTEEAIPQKIQIYHNSPHNVEEEDDPENWEDVSEDSWSVCESGRAFKEILTKPNPSPPESWEEEKPFCDNPQLDDIRAQMDRIRLATQGSLVRPSRRVTELFGTLEMQPPIIQPTLMIRENGLTALYVRDISRNSALTSNDHYVFKRNVTDSMTTESYFRIDLAFIQKGSQIISQRATLSEGSEIATLPNLLWEIKNRDDEYMVRLQTSKYGKERSKIDIYFERRALWLESIVRRIFTLTPLVEQSKTIELILEIADLYYIRQWRQAVENSKFRITSKNIDHATEKMWDKWMISLQGLAARSIFESFFSHSSIFQSPIVDAIFGFCCPGMWKIFLRFAPLMLSSSAFNTRRFTEDALYRDLYTPTVDW